ncbi:glucose-6-phosphate isomerase [candidate division KSB1 bacterium]
MENYITLDYTNVLESVSIDEIKQLDEKIRDAVHLLETGKGKGSDFLGWYDPAAVISKNEIEDIKTTSQYIRETFESFVVLGIGGSYLGARAVINALSNSFDRELPSTKPKIYYSGFNLDSAYTRDLLNLISKKNTAVCVISKSGTTTETALAFRIFYDFLKNKFGNVKNRIYVITDREKGALKQVAEKEGFKTFIIPDNVGGRFSVLTPVGLLPVSAAGFNIDELIRGAVDESIRLKETDLFKNPSHMYAAIRYLLFKKGKIIEILANFNYKLIFLSKWWKQLFGESEGKNNSGIFPASVNFTTDLHSLGQIIQEGVRNIFETFLQVDNIMGEMKIPGFENDPDKFNFLAGTDIEKVNLKALEGTRIAHKEGGVPNMTITLPEITEYYLGKLIYFFEKSVAIGGYLLNVNPFDQPGVEQYKKNMFALLNKDGFEEENKRLTKLIKNIKTYKV